MPSSSKQPLATSWGLYAYVLAAMVLILDQLSKWWILNVLHLDLKGQIQVLPVFRLTMVMNPGVSFGLMRADTALGRGLLVGAALIVVIALIAWVRKADRPLFATAIGLVIGGALGNNLIDRIRIGRVVDFIDVSGGWVRSINQLLGNCFKGWGAVGGTSASSPMMKVEFGSRLRPGCRRSICFTSRSCRSRFSDRNLIDSGNVAIARKATTIGVRPPTQNSICQPKVGI